MSIKGRNLQPGDVAMTDFNGRGMTRVVIIDRKSPASSQSRILFRVDPPLKGGDCNTWYDADWFEPVPNVELSRRRLRRSARMQG